MIGKRFGHIGEQLVKIIIVSSENTELGEKLYFKDYINDFLKNYFIENAFEECCTNNAEKLTMDL